ncbi:MAG: hypothetical protein HZC28_03930 [Spirochaetes bacterium]|nr:hypothetical protein [Spirochaetota bacterium]
MIKNLSFAALLIAASIVWGAPQKPPQQDTLLEYEGDARLFVDLDQISLMAEAKGRIESIDPDDSFRYRSLTVGAYWRLFPQLHLGGFYRIASGATHSDDWIWPTVPEWFWQDTTRRPEHTIIGDITFRQTLPFIPGTWMAELKSQYQFTYYHDDYQYFTEHDVYLHVIRLRPGVTTQLFLDGEPFALVYANADMYIPINFKPQPFYAWYVYLGSLFTITDDIAAGPFIAYRNTAWVTSSDYKRAPTTDEYSVTHRSFNIGVSVVITLRPLE